MCSNFYQENIEDVWRIKSNRANTYHKTLRPSESILPSDALKGIPLSAK